MVKRVILGLRRRLAQLASEGAYRFLVRDWSGVNDIDALQYFFSTEFYWFQMRTVEPDLKAYKKVLVLAPHQDDESMGAGGLLLKLAQQGSEIKVLYTTDGRQPNIGVSLEASVDVRNKEAKEALKFINASFEQIDLSNFEVDLKMEHLQQLSRSIDEFAPDLLLIPWILDIPDIHRLTNHMFLLANDIKPMKNFEVWSYQVHNHVYPNIGINITDQIDEKMEMIRCFESQLRSFKAYDHILKGLNAYNSKFLKDSEYVELFFGLPVEKYIELIDRLYTNAGDNMYRQKKGVLKALVDLKKGLSKKSSNIH